MTSSNDTFDQLRDFLKVMFQFGDNDLDFGIYRITRLKRQFIEGFIDGEDANSLRTTVTQALSDVSNQQGEAARNWLSAFAGRFGDKGDAYWKALAEAPSDAKANEDFAKLLQLSDDHEREQAEAQLKTFIETRELASDDLEARVYNHLLNFFELYYSNGDFGYNSRASSAFKVPYEADYDGSDTLFHWKHKDSYYIKTGNGFHSVRFEVNGQWLELRLGDGGDEQAQTTARNNNKDSERKHYRLAGIEQVEEIDKDGKPIKLWQVRFALATASTPKAEIYTQLWQQVFNASDDLTPYLHKKPGKDETPPGKPAFNDLTGDYEKTGGGQVKGLGQLRLSFDKYIDEIAKRNEFVGLGSNAEKRQAALMADPIAHALWQIDRNLNKFYVGNDADYFIHKDLQGFLTREKARFIKQVVFSDLSALLHAGEDNLTVLIARAFNAVADTLIGFLAAIENFQKALFELKKKVVDTHYLVSVGKIPAQFYARVFACKAQRTEWQDLFKVKIGKAAQLADHPTLVVDTRLYRDSDPEFQDDLLGLPEFDNLDDQTDGLLINSENWQALNLLQEKFREQIKCIYIDPPYNTGGDGFLYKDSFRHSSWASMIHDRLSAMKPLGHNTSAMLMSIDENEDLQARQVLNDIFGPESYVASMVWEGGRKNDSKLVSVSHEIVQAYVFDRKSMDAGGVRWLVKKEGLEQIYSAADRCLENAGGNFDEASQCLKTWYRGLEEGSPSKKHSHYWAIDERGVYFPSDISWPGGGGPRYDVTNKRTGGKCKVPSRGWMYPTLERMNEAIADSLVHFPFTDDKVPCGKTYLKETEFHSPSSVFYKDGRAATKRLRHIIGANDFKNPKDETILAELVGPIVSDGDYLADFFAGSGASSHAALILNKNGRKIRFIAVEMGAHFDSVLVARLKRICFSQTWKKGLPVGSEGQIALLKVQELEQYEDTLDNLHPAWDEAGLPPQVSVRYLFRPEENAIYSSLDVSRPFAQTLCVGKARSETPIDLMETWCYLQGYWVRSRRVVRQFDRPYLAVETTHGVLVVLRDIDPAEDDTANLKTILAGYADDAGVSRIQRLEVNFDADKRRMEIETVLISADDFVRGARWS